MRLPLVGGCQCRTVRYEVTMKPLTVYACHCTECQKQSAGAFSLSMVVPREAVAVTAGEPKEWLRRQESGRQISCIFCGRCGARLFHNPVGNQQITIIKPGTLDDTSWLYPVGHIWTRSAQRWFEIPKDTINYENQPLDFSRLIQAWQAQKASAS